MTTYTESTDANGALWLTDKNGNRASCAHFGSREAAEKALASLLNCTNCTNCSECSYCSNCTNCTYCSKCTNCTKCTNCSDCSRCTNCTDKTMSAPPIPKIENIHQRVLDAITADGCALNMLDWHTCETTHCRAGWVVHLAGEAGYALEKFHNTELAAMLIYRESGSPINPRRFHGTNEDAMADIERCAAQERAGGR